MAEEFDSAVRISIFDPELGRHVEVDLSNVRTLPGCRVGPKHLRTLPARIADPHPDAPHEIHSAEDDRA